MSSGDTAFDPLATTGGPPPRQHPPPRLGEEDPSKTAVGPDTTSNSEKSGGDWPVQAADFVVETVDRIRDLTTNRVLTVIRGVVYGTAIVILSMVVLVLIVLTAMRLLNAYLPGDVWSSYLLIGSILTISGLIMWSKRKSPAG